MKNFTKLLAVILVFVIALSTAACSLTPQYSYKTDDAELAIGVYIYALYSAYSQAESLAQQTEGYDSEAGTYDGSKSFLDVQITDEDGVTATADQWIADEADTAVKNLLAVEHEFNRLGATIDEATMQGYEASAKEYWEYGPYYSMYGEQYINPYKDIFEPLGVSYESFEYFYIASAMQEVVFDTLYAADGEKAVSDKELTEYFEDNYTSYTYFNTNLYEIVEETSEEGEALSSNKALSKKEVNKKKDQYQGYVDSINNGSDIKDVLDSYAKDNDLEGEQGTSNVEIMADSTIGEDLVTAIEKLDESKASYEIIGEEDSRVIYFFYKEPIKEQTKNYIEDEANRKSVLQNLKGEEFTDYIDQVANKLNITISRAVKKYSPKMFEA
ncbi:MAG: hypothetical protein E7513_05935 [Ruminococcaceae bacterium]|nr:hypothetical protein [Oscillospiraceae bacterium]